MRPGVVWGTSDAERTLPSPCDRWLERPDDVVFRAIDVTAPAAVLFRWLCQLRAAPYSYDLIDNFGRRSPGHLIPGLDVLETGQRFMTFFELVEFESGRHITLRSDGGWLGAVAVTYLVEPTGDRASRLVVKMLVSYPRAAPIRAVLRLIFPAADLVMMRKQLLTLKRLAETTPAA